MRGDEAMGKELPLWTEVRMQDTEYRWTHLWCGEVGGPLAVRSQP